MSIDLSTFKAPFIPPEEAWANADAIRGKYWPSGELPIDPELIAVDLGLHISTSPLLIEEYDTDAYLDTDLKNIVVDAGFYNGNKTQNRVRFSIAHELGHFILHSDVIKEIAMGSPKDWMRFKQEIPEKQWSLLEFHAREFAGRLLVPSNRLREELGEALKMAKAEGFEYWEKSAGALLEYLGTHISRTFGVSSIVIQKRIEHEGLSLKPPE